MGKRNFEWEQATVWDGFFTQDKPGGVTQRVDPETVFARLQAEGFLLDSVSYLVNRLANSRDVLWSLDSTGEKLESTLFQVSGLGAQLVPVETDFDWAGTSTLGGRGVSPGRVYIDGVDTKVWAVQEARGDLLKSTDNWKTSVRDSSLYTYLGGYGVTFPVVKFLHMDGVSLDAWVCGSDTGLIYAAYHVPENYNADGTLKVSAWFVIYPPYLVADIGTDGHVSCMVGNHGAIMRTTDWLTFSVVYSGAAVLGGVDTDRYGNWIAVERDTGRVLRSTDNGATWSFPTIYLDDVAVANLPPTGSVTAGNGIWLASGNSAYEYSEDGIHWYSGTNTLGSFYGCGFDGSRFYASEPNTANPYRLFQLLVSEVPFQRHLSALKGATIKGDTWLVDLPSVSVLSTDENGRLQDGEGALFTVLDGRFVDLTSAQTVHGVKDFVDGAGADFLSVQQFVAFGTNPDGAPHLAGRTYWDSVDHTLATDLPNGVTLQHGQELHLLGRNVSGGTLTNGTVVYCNGSQGFRATIDKAEADVAAHSMALAVLTQDVANNGLGFGTAFGLVRDLDTSAFSEGAVLYLSSTAGQLTATRPAAPNVGVRVALCVRSHPSAGMLFVSIDRFPTLSELSDTLISSPSAGQVLTYDGTKWVNAAAWTYTLPVASATVLGGIKIGAGLSIDGDGVVSALATPYTLPEATTTTLGGVKVGRGLQVAAGVLTDNDSYTFRSDNAGAAGAGKWTKVLSFSDPGNNDYIAFRLQVTTSYTAQVFGVWKIDIEPRQGAVTPTPSVRMLESDGAAADDVVVVVVSDYPTAPCVYEVWTKAKANNVETGWTVRDLFMVGGAVPPSVTYYDVTPWVSSYTAGTATAGVDARPSPTAAASYSLTMDPTACAANVQLRAGSSTQWSAHATLFVPVGNQAIVQNQTKLAIICPQPVSGASYILAIYKWPATGSTCTLVAASSVQTMPEPSSWLEATISTASTTLVGGDRYFAVILWNGNGALVAGLSGPYLNVQPYIAWGRANMGVLSAAPATISPENELQEHFFLRVRT
jgi:hypothetical protein